jgi:hypothetical protein
LVHKALRRPYTVEMKRRLKIGITPIRMHDHHLNTHLLPISNQLLLDPSQLASSLRRNIGLIHKSDDKLLQQEEVRPFPLLLLLQQLADLIQDIRFALRDCEQLSRRRENIYESRLPISISFVFVFVFVFVFIVNLGVRFQQAVITHSHLPQLPKPSQ